MKKLYKWLFGTKWRKVPIQVNGETRYRLEYGGSLVGWRIYTGYKIGEGWERVLVDFYIYPVFTKEEADKLLEEFRQL